MDVLFSGNRKVTASAAASVAVACRRCGRRSLPKIHASGMFYLKEPASFRFMSRALVSASGLSLTSLLLHLHRFLSEPSDPVFDPCPVCPTFELPSLDFGPSSFHTPSLLVGIALGLLLFPILELLVVLRGIAWARVERVLRPPFRYRLL